MNELMEQHSISDRDLFLNSSETHFIFSPEDYEKFLEMVEDRQNNPRPPTELFLQMEEAYFREVENAIGRPSHPDEVVFLKAKTDRQIEAHQAIKDTLMAALADWIKEKGLTRDEAAKALDVPDVRVSDIIHQRPYFSIDDLIILVGRTGQQVQVHVVPAREV
jgi:predicted XRE-type DNA-binding protein